MGLLDRWIKRKTEEQLNKDIVTRPSEKKATPAVASASAAKSSSSKKTVEKEDKVKKSTVLKKEKNNEEKQNQSQIETSIFAQGIIIRPLTTEKTTYLQSENKYVFLVTRASTKNQVKRAIKQLYGVEPLAVRVINVQGKAVRFGRTQGRRSDYKKAIITLPKESSIKIHETV